MNVAIVGASGFIGLKLVEYLLDTSPYTVLALSRNPLPINIMKKYPRLRWRSVDLHNLLTLEQALEGIHVAIYLVHSMLPSARLNQGNFADFDLSLADNFGRAAYRAGIRQVIYLSGLIPDREKLSLHLQSRREVEEVLKSYIPKLTTIRAGLIIGEGGSSFTIMYRLVQRLPLMICPTWTQSICQPIFVDDVIRVLAYCIDREECFGRIYDVGVQEKWTYLGLMKLTAKKMHRKVMFIVVPLFSPNLSRLWVSLVANAPKSLAYPLIQSLEEDMTTHPERTLSLPDGEFVHVDKSLSMVLQRYTSSQTTAQEKMPHAFIRSLRSTRQKSVRSIQRLSLPAGRDAEWVAQQYMEWLPRFFKGLIKVTIKQQTVTFFVKGLPLKLLILRYSPERSQKDRQLFYVIGGLLAGHRNVRGRLEMRETLGGRAIIVAVHDFVPALPWFLYRLTQAKVHSFVMSRFAGYVRLSDSIEAA
ncbi:MAG: NAD(P)H-binding protein [Oligoflexus sp.]